MPCTDAAHGENARGARRITVAFLARRVDEIISFNRRNLSFYSRGQ
ncbi:hypothetical protein EZV77_24730 [Burkholderia thailandensis]|uniref:Uncharacterized protein n=1 Tax=Burkholderia thailandensis TaxID=57975 RepID=A0AAW9D5U0_BURTH|nr:hypothetical protein A8H32_10625 [Burkholderia thailandensis]MDD1479123.1 hypothetical protein [Burkholderia thailandensis]MDD1485840.1 hypothetical protein [Burkholderia thailandensis]MDD1490994.1 hypothetical protein [Burkholderia thailandensis]MDW9240617.1 hypothetical protein [Burkholderia thailandensis]